MTFATHLDRFGQTAYECPTCGKAFLTVLPDRPADKRTLDSALAFHVNAEHPFTARSRRRLWWDYQGRADIQLAGIIALPFLLIAAVLLVAR
jgi:hypothetical protein